MIPEPVKHWCKNVLIAFDQLGNAVIGGYADETISARSYRNEHKSFGWMVMRIIVDTLFLLVGQVNHCKESYK